MHFLRRSAVQRVFSLSLLLGVTLWLAVPATGASQRTLAAQAAGLGVPAGLRAAFETALAEARTPDAFVEAVAAALAARPGGEALADLLDAEPDALLALLYGHLIQALGHPEGPLAVPGTVGSAAAGPAPLGAATPAPAPARPLVVRAAQALGTVVLGVVPVGLLTSAQPLGP